MSVATKAKSMVADLTDAAKAIVATIATQQAKVDAALADRDAMQSAYDAALARYELGEGSEEAVEHAKAALDKAEQKYRSACATLRELETRDLKKAEKATADRLKADWDESEALSKKGVALFQQYVADCKRIEATVRELAAVNQRLDVVSPRRRASADLREMIVGPRFVKRLMTIMKALVPSLHPQPGIQPHAKGVEHFIKSEIEMVRQFGDRNFKEGN